MRATPISVKDYFRKEISKANRPQVDDRLKYTSMNFLKSTEMKQMDIVQKTVQPQRHTSIEQKKQKMEFK